MKRRFISGIRRNRSGVASVEMALMIPVLFAFMFTTFEAGNYLWTDHKIIKATRQGARYVARLPFSSFNCATGTVENATMLAQVKTTMRTGSPTGAGSIKVRGWTDSDISITVSCISNSSLGTDKGLYTSKGSAPVVTVSSRVKYPAIVGLLGFDTSNTFVRSQAQAAVTGL